MKFFDLDKWEKDGHEELARARESYKQDYTPAGESRTWILIVTAAFLYVSAVALLGSGIAEATGHALFDNARFFFIGAALFGLIGIAYTVGIIAGRTAASTKSISLAENAMTMICSGLIALASVSILIYHFVL